jgi:hypothetical protein
MNSAYVAGHCDECLVDSTLAWSSRPDGRRDLVYNMDHLPGCPLALEAVKALAATHGTDFLPDD